MGKFSVLSMLFAGAVVLGIAGTSVGADENKSGENKSVEDHKLIFVPAVRIIARTKLNAAVRGELKSLSASAAFIVPDRARFRNPEGIEYKLEKLQYLNILDADMKWTDGEDAGQFLTKLSQKEGLPILNIVQFQQAELAKSGLNSPGGGSLSDLKVMRPANGKTDPDGSITTVVCGNCFKQVSVKSDTDQKCPHCGILWDNSEPDAVTMTPKMQGANATDPGALALGANTGMNPAAGQQGRPVGAPQPNLQGAQPVVVPQPVQLQTQPQEVTMENLPLWLKAGIFCACMGICYYAVFVR